MKLLLSLLALLTFTATATSNTDSLITETEHEHELGIAPIEIEAPPRAEDDLVLDLPDYNQDTIVKKIDIDKKHQQKHLKYRSQRIKKSM